MHALFKSSEPGPNAHQIAYLNKCRQNATSEVRHQTMIPSMRTNGIMRPGAMHSTPSAEDCAAHFVQLLQCLLYFAHLVALDSFDTLQMIELDFLCLLSDPLHVVSTYQHMCKDLPSGSIMLTRSPTRMLTASSGAA